MTLRLIIILLFACLFNTSAQNIPEKPEPARFVNDFADVLSSAEENALERKLLNYQDTTSNQIAIVTVRSLEGYDIESYSYKLASTWGLGQKDKNNGILVLAAIQDRKLRIEVGYGLEGAVTDAETKQVIREVMKPAFKQNEYYQGFDQATTELIKIAAGEYKANPKNREKGSRGVGVFFLLILIFIIFSIISKVRRVRNSHIGDNLTLWTILSLLSSSNRRNRGGGWGGGGSGSGGGFDFGGGSFGGGGSSGDW